MRATLKRIFVFMGSAGWIPESWADWLIERGGLRNA